MKISIIGSGAMGSLSRDAVPGPATTWCCTTSSRSTSRPGDRAGGSSEVLLTRRPAATTDLEDTRGSDVMIVFVKSTSTEEAAREVAPSAGPGTIALARPRPAGNEAILRKYFGVEPEARGGGDLARRDLPRPRGASGTRGRDPRTSQWPTGSHPRLVAFAAALARAGFETHVEPTWRASCGASSSSTSGSTTNALTALTGGKRPPARPRGDTIADGRPRGGGGGGGEGAGRLLRVRRPARHGVRRGEEDRANRSSMLQDFDRGRCNGDRGTAPSCARRRSSLPVPVNAGVMWLVKAIDRLLPAWRKVAERGTSAGCRLSAEERRLLAAVDADERASYDDLGAIHWNVRDGKHRGGGAVRGGVDMRRELDVELLVEEAGPGRCQNVIATVDSGLPGPCLMLEGHTDVVSEGARGAVDPRSFRRRDRRRQALRPGLLRHEGRPVRRGAPDGEGDREIRASLEAQGKIRLGLVCDEEGMMIGIKDFMVTPTTWMPALSPSPRRTSSACS